MAKLKFEFPPKMEEFVRSFLLNLYRHYVLSGGRGSAKSYTIGELLLMVGASTRLNIVCLREIQNSIADSVHKQLELQIEKYKIPFYSVGKEYITNKKTGTIFSFEGMYRNIQTFKSIPDIDIAWLEEANKFSEESLKVIIPTVRKDKSRLVYSFNPEFETDPIWQRFMIKKRLKTFYSHTTYEDNPYTTQDFIDEAIEMKNDDPNGYENVYGGELRQEGDDLLIRLLDYKQATERLVSDEGQIEMGVDCARYGDDQSVIVKRKGFKMLSINEHSKLSIPQLAQRIIFEANGDKEMPIKIDEGGLGAGVYDIVKEEGYNVVPVNFNNVAINPNRYHDTISEMWKEFRDNLGSYGLIHRERLKKELTNRKYKVDNKGRFQIESKDDYKKRMGKSPDHADAVLLSFYKKRNNFYYGFA